MSSTAKPTEAVVMPETTSTSAQEPDDFQNEDAFELDDRLVAEQFILREKQKLLEKRHLFQQQLKSNNQKTNTVSGGDGEKVDLQPMKAVPILNTAAAPECEESNKLTEQGVHSLTHSVTDELSEPISEIDDDPHFDHTEVSSENCMHASPLSGRTVVGTEPTEEDGHNLPQKLPEVDDFEAADGGIIDSGSGGKPHSEQVEGRIWSSIGAVKEGNGESPNGDGEVFDASQEVPQEKEEHPNEMKLYSLSGQQDSVEFSSNQNNILQEKKSVSIDAEVDDADSNLGAREPRQTHDEERPEISLFYPQQLDPEDVINPFSLEVRIRKAREQQDIALEWEAETIAENRAEISHPQVDLEDTSRSILPNLEKRTSDEPTGSSSERVVENGFHPQVKERIKTGSESDDLNGGVKELPKKTPGVGEAVLLGALASGVNKPTWFVIRAVLVALVASLLLMLHVAIKSDSWFVLLNVLFLISIAGGLVLLLVWYISETGFVSVDKQMAELNLTSEPQKVASKTL
ncbi:unnamed protein product [Calypogeia fissa]